MDLRERVVSYVEAGHSRRAAAANFRVSPSFAINLMTAFRERGAVAPKALGGWRHSKLGPHRVFILRCVAEKNDISMPELAGELQAASGVKADPASLSRWLIRNGLSFKKSLQASECDRPDVRQAREAWKAERQPKMRTEPHRLVYIDETGTNTKMTRARGRCDRGERLRSKAPFGHWKTQTFVAGLRCGALTAPWVIDAPMDRAIFETYVRSQIAPTLQEGDIVILDNLPPTKAPPPTKPSASEALGCCFCRPTAPTSIPLKRPSPSSRRTCAPWPCAPSMNSGTPSGKSAISSSHRNVQSTSKPQGMHSNERPML
jgi:transposase